MADETHAVGLVLSGYVGAKVFGPTLDKVGIGIRDFFSARFVKIAKSFEQKVEGKELHPLAPAFLFRFVEHASYSEDTDEITEMWANLLADAAVAQSNKHVNFIDILSQLGPREVKLLDDMVGPSPVALPGNTHTYLRSRFDKLYSEHPKDPESVQDDLGTSLLNENFGWPMTVLETEVHYSRRGKYVQSHGQARFADRLAIDILARQRLLEIVTFDFGGIPTSLARVAVVTPLGLDFVCTCRGIPPDEFRSTGIAVGPATD